MTMESGSLDTLITIQTRGETTKDAAGAPVVSWSTLAQVFAKRRDLTGRELLLAQQITPLAQCEFTIRYMDGITTKHAVLDEDGTRYDITHIAQVGRREGLKLLTKLPGEV